MHFHLGILSVFNNCRPEPSLTSLLTVSPINSNLRKLHKAGPTLMHIAINISYCYYNNKNCPYFCLWFQKKDCASLHCPLVVDERTCYYKCLLARLMMTMFIDGILSLINRVPRVLQGNMETLDKQVHL